MILLCFLLHVVTCAASSPKFTQRRFGVNVHKDQSIVSSAMMPLCEAAQVTRQDGWWRNIEPSQKGVYDWTFTDGWMAAVNRSKGNNCAAGQSNPMLQHFLLMGGNHLYTGEDKTSPTTQAAVAGYTNFVVAMMSRYAGQGILWEIYNEADLEARGWTVGQYSALLTSVGKAVRANSAIASEVIIGPSTSTVNCNYVRTLKSDGALQYVDAVSVHSYTAGGPEQMRSQYAAMRQVVGPNIAVLSGEWGWATCTDSNGRPSNCVGGTMPDVVSVRDQAMYVARQWLVNALDRIPLSIVYEYTNGDGDKGTAYDRTQAEMNYGMRMRESGAAKPAYNAAVTVQKFVGRRPFLSQLGDIQSNVEYVLAFGSEGDGPPAVAAELLDGKTSRSNSTVGDVAEVFAVWTLSAVGSSSDVTGSGDNAYCAGDALFTGMSSDCNALCIQTPGCRGFVTYDTGKVHANSNCQLTASRCTIPRPVSGCGINIPKASDHCVGTQFDEEDEGDLFDSACDSAVAHTLTQSTNPPPVVFTLPTGTRSTCFSVFDMLGKALPDVCASSGKMTVKATEEPVYLVGK
jgi:hypothetical protein